MVEKHQTGNAVNSKDSSTIAKKQASTQTDRCLGFDTRDKLIETDPLFCWNCSQLVVTMETNDQTEAAHLNIAKLTNRDIENKQLQPSLGITPTKSKATKGNVTPEQTSPRETMSLRQNDIEKNPQKPKERSTCNIENRNILSFSKTQLLDISIRPENNDVLKETTQCVQDFKVKYSKDRELSNEKKQVSSVKEDDQTQKKKHRRKAKNKNKNINHCEEMESDASKLKPTHSIQSTLKPNSSQSTLKPNSSETTLKPTNSSQNKTKTEPLQSKTTKSDLNQNGSQKETAKKKSKGLNCTHSKSVYLGGKKSQTKESDLETILQDFEKEYSTNCLQYEEEVQSQKFSNTKKAEAIITTEEYFRQGARPKVSLKTKGPYFSGDSSHENLEKPSSNPSKGSNIKPKESLRDSDYLSMMQQWPANIGKSTLLKKEKSKYVCKVKEALDFVVYFRPVDYCVSEVQLDSPHSIPMVGENRMGLTDFADLFLMHDLLPYYQIPPAPEHYEMVFETLKVRGTPLNREVFITHLNGASGQDGTLGQGGVPLQGDGTLGQGGVPLQGDGTLGQGGVPLQGEIPNQGSLPSFNDIFTSKTSLSNTKQCKKIVTSSKNKVIDNIKKLPIKVHTSSVSKSKPQNNSNVPKYPYNKTLSKSPDGTKSAESFSHEFKIPSPKHASLSVTLHQPIVLVSPNQDLHISAVQAPPSAPQAPPSAQHAPPSAPKAPPSAPQAPPSAPQAPPYTAQAPPSAPQAPPSAPQTPPSAPQAPPSASQASPSCLQAPLSAPIAPPSAPQASPFCLQAPPSAPQAPPSAPQAPPYTAQAPPSAPQAPPSAPQASPSARQAPSSFTEAKSSASQAPSSAQHAPPSAPQTLQSLPHHLVAKSSQSISTTQNVEIIITPPEEISSAPPTTNPKIRRTTRHKGPILCMACNGAGCGDPKRQCYAEVYRDTRSDDLNSSSDTSDSTIFDFDESVDYEESLNSFTEDDTDVVSPPPTYEKAMELGMTKNDDTNTGFHSRIKRLPRPHLREHMKRCMNCRRRKGVSLKLCLRCEMAAYCCKECLLEDHQKHRDECKHVYKWKCACQRLEPYMLHYLTNYNLQVVTEFRQVPDCYQSLQGFNRALLCEVSGLCDYYPKEDYAVFIQDESGLEVPLVFSVNEGSYYMPDSSQPIPLSRLLYPGRFIIFLHPVWLLFRDFREGFRLTDLRNMFVIKELSEL